MNKLPDWDNLGFKVTETDMMYIATCNDGEEWQSGELRPYGHLSLHPAAGVLNYGQGIFEGMKATRTTRGNIVLFRPEDNARRFMDGAERLGMPPVPENLYLAAVYSVVAANARWVPPPGKGALYIRPLLWGTGAVLGVNPAPSYSFVIYTSPVGPYFKGGFKPIRLIVAKHHFRAAPGGTGNVKAIGNYASGLILSRTVKKHGYGEILYLDAVHQRYIEEVGAANFFCIKDNTLYTPELGGTILPGITRDSVMKLARYLGYSVVEQKVDINLAMKADEAFCTGTAAVITPIGRIEQGDEIKIFSSQDTKQPAEENGDVGPITRQLYDLLTSIHIEVQEDIYGWLRPVTVDTSSEQEKLTTES